jgi:hypothetical protein
VAEVLEFPPNVPPVAENVTERAPEVPVRLAEILTDLFFWPLLGQVRVSRS